MDLENSRLSVRRTFTEGRILLGEPKTKKSRRTIRLTKAAIRALRWHLARQIGYVECLGDLYRDQGLVFASEVGSPMNPTNLRRRSFAALLGRANLPRIRFHDLRHAPALQERQPEDRLRDAWARVNQHHPGHLLAHAP